MRFVGVPIKRPFSIRRVIMVPHASCSGYSSSCKLKNSIRRTTARSSRPAGQVSVVGMIYGPMEFLSQATPYADPHIAWVAPA